MKKEAKLLLNRAIDSLLLSVEYFNRPWDRGRTESVLIFLDHSFEMLLKSSIVHKGGNIRDSGTNETIGFKRCVNKCMSDEQLKCLSEDQTVTLRMLNDLRDAAYHHILDISEQMLYVHTQAGVATFTSILREVFNKSVADFLPKRVLPISTEPPSELTLMMDKEFSQIRELLSANKRRRTECKARLRSVAIMENAIQGGEGQPSERELNRLIKNVKNGQAWKSLFPGVASLKLSADDSGIGYHFRISKTVGAPMRVAEEGEESVATIAIKRVSELSYYSLSVTQLAHHLGITVPKTGALIRCLKIKQNPEYFKEIKLRSTPYEQYSQKALQHLREEVSKVNMEEVWKMHKPQRKSRSERL